MSAYFITGTGTDIGKTWLTCALLRHWLSTGRPAAGFKPVLSGYSAENLAQSDAGLLLAAQGLGPTPSNVELIAPWRYAAPLSPDMAAAAEARSIDIEALVAFTRQAAAGSDIALIEGVGGVMVPLDSNLTVRDWIARSGLSSVLVAGSYLGSLSHTLTALAALREVGAGVTAIVVNETPHSTVSLAATLASLRSHAGTVPVLAVERANPSAGIAALATLL